MWGQVECRLPYEYVPRLLRLLRLHTCARPAAPDPMTETVTVTVTVTTDRLPLEAAQCL